MRYSATVLRRTVSDPDAFGNPGTSYVESSELTVVGLAPVGSAEAVPGRDEVELSWDVYTRATGSQLPSALDRLRIGEVIYEVIGSPQLWTSARSGPSGAVIRARRIEG